ncbi:MAG: ATP-binding protein, partial [Athalassotoga sp.]
LLIIDELGYLPLDSEGAKLFFELISEKYEQGSVIVTSNRSFNEWNKIFEDEVIATAVLDRLLHHSTIINIRGKSYRLREKQKSGMIRLDTSKIIDENAQN